MLFLFEQLRTELQRLELVGVVLEIDSRCSLLQKVCTLHSNLCVALRIVCVGPSVYVLQLVDAVALVRLVVLDEDDLFQADGCLLGVGDKLLIKACDVAVRDFNRSEPLLNQDVFSSEILAVLNVILRVILRNCNKVS